DTRRHRAQRWWTAEWKEKPRAFSCRPPEVVDTFRVRGAVRDESAVVQAMGEALEAGFGYRRGARPEAGAVIALEGRAQQFLRHVGKERSRHARELGRPFLRQP